MSNLEQRLDDAAFVAASATIGAAVGFIAAYAGGHIGNELSNSLETAITPDEAGTIGALALGTAIGYHAIVKCYGEKRLYTIS
jgi:hypothetical protein